MQAFSGSGLRNNGYEAFALRADPAPRAAIVGAVGLRLTAERPALVSGATRRYPGARSGVARGWPADGAPVTVYRRRRRVRRRLAVGAVVATGALGFAVAAAAMTLPELVAGRSLGTGDRQTTLFGGKPHAAVNAGPTTTGETAPEREAETETTPTSVTETTPGATETTAAPQRQPDYQPRQSATPQPAPAAQPSEPRPAPSETESGTAPRP